MFPIAASNIRHRVASKRSALFRRRSQVAIVTTTTQNRAPDALSAILRQQVVRHAIVEDSEEDFVHALIETESSIHVAKRLSHAVSQRHPGTQHALALQLEATQRNLAEQLPAHLVPEEALRRGCPKLGRRIAEAHFLPLIGRAAQNTDVLDSVSSDERLEIRAQLAATSFRAWAALCAQIAGSSRPALLGPILSYLRDATATATATATASEEESMVGVWLRLPAVARVALIQLIKQQSPHDHHQHRHHHHLTSSAIRDCVAATVYDLNASRASLRVASASGPAVSFALMSHLMYAAVVDTAPPSPILVEELFFRSVEKLPMLIAAAPGGSIDVQTAIPFLASIYRLLVNANGFITQQRALTAVATCLCHLLPALDCDTLSLKRQHRKDDDDDVQRLKLIELVASIVEHILALGCLRPAVDAASIWVAIPDLVDFRAFPLTLLECLLLTAKSCGETRSSPIVAALTRMYRSRDWLRTVLSSGQHAIGGDHAPVLTQSRVVDLGVIEESQDTFERELGLVLAPGGFFARANEAPASHAMHL